jgi:hypothetical protein
VVKAYCSEIGVDVASLGIQVHGGMGYIEETGAAQDWRDARVAPIYEGTNGIQAIDLVTRKIGRAGGAAVWDLLSELRKSAGAPGAATVEALDALEASTRWLLDRSRSQEERLAGATPYLRLFGLAISGAMLAKSAAVSNALSHGGSSDAHHLERMVVTQFHTENLAVAAHGLARQVTGGSASVLASRGLSALGSEVGRPPVLPAAYS